MAKVRKKKSASKNTVVIKHEAIFNTIFGYARQILEWKENNPDRYLDGKIYKISKLVFSYFETVVSKTSRFSKKTTDNITKYLDNNVYTVMDEDIKTNKKLVPEVMLLLSLDYLLNEAKHNETKKIMSLHRHMFNHALYMLKEYSNAPAVVGYNQLGLMKMLDKTNDALVIRKLSFADKIREKQKYLAKLLLSVMHLYWDDIEDSDMLVCINKVKLVIAEINENSDELFNENIELLKSYIEKEVFYTDDDGDIPIGRNTLFYSIIGKLASIKQSNIYSTYFDEVKYDLNNKDISNNPLILDNSNVVFDILTNFEVKENEIPDKR